MPRAEGRAPGVGRRRHWCGSGGWGVGCAPRQAELERGAGGDDGQDSTAHRRGRCGTPGATHAGEQATDALLGRQGHGLPALVLGVLVAEADLVILDGEQAGLVSAHPVDIPAQVSQDWARCLARPGWQETTHPVVQTDSGSSRSGRSCRTSARNSPRKSCERAWTGPTEDGRAGRHSVRSAETPPAGTRQCTCGWEAKVRGQVCSTHHHPDQPAAVVGGRGQLDERLGRGTDQEVVESWLMTADNRPARVGPGEDDVNGGHRQACLTSFCQPGCGVLVVACGATAVAAGVVGIVLLPAVVARHTGARLQAAVRPWSSSHGATMAGQEVLARTAPGPHAPSRRKTSATSGMDGLQRGHRSAMRAVMVACTTSKVGGVRGVSRAVVLGLLWPSRACMTRRATPRATDGSQ